MPAMEKKKQAIRTCPRFGLELGSDQKVPKTIAQTDCSIGVRLKSPFGR